MTMESLVRAFPEQLREAVAADPGALHPPRPVRRLVSAGMGGSGIGAELMASLAGLRVPLHAVRDYRLPDWAGADTLVLASSHSGNTEETVALVEQALEAGCAVAAVSSGGTLAELGAGHGFDVLPLPEGRPPRSCLGYSMVQQLRLADHFGLAAEGWADAVARTADFLEARSDALRGRAAELADLLAGGEAPRTAVLYAAADWAPVLRRWCQQVQENAKRHAWMNLLPEMNHNELVGWHDRREDLVPLFFASPLDDARTAERLAWTRERVAALAPHARTVHASGTDRWEQAFAWIHLGDWLSVELAARLGVDPMDIGVIEDLKAHLAGSPAARP